MSNKERNNYLPERAGEGSDDGVDRNRCLSRKRRRWDECLDNSKDERSPVRAGRWDDSLQEGSEEIDDGEMDNHPSVGDGHSSEADRPSFPEGGDDNAGVYTRAIVGAKKEVERSYLLSFLVFPMRQFPFVMFSEPLH